MKNTKNKEKNKTAIILTIVALIIALISGGTYAWWTWASADNTDTNVNITIDDFDPTINGGGNITSKNLVPTTCSNTTYAIQRTINYSVRNPSTVDSIFTLQLNPTTFPTQLRNAKLMWKITTAANCGGTEVATGTFSSTTQGRVMDLTTVSVPKKTTTAMTGTYYLSIWLDSSYTATNTGNTVSDTIQDKTMTLNITGIIEQNGS